MKYASFDTRARGPGFCRPKVETLESRAQPGSMLFGGLDTSLLAGSIGSLDNLVQPVPVLQPPATTAAPGDTSAQLLAAPVQGNGAETPVRQTPATQDLLPAAMPDSQLQVMESARGIQSREANASLNLTPLTIDKIHETGGGCGGGNLLVNGDFETGALAPWTVAMPPFQDAFVNVLAGGGDLTPDHRLQLGTVGGLNLISQTVADNPGQVYMLNYSVQNLVGGMQTYFDVLWNGVSVPGALINPPAFAYVRPGPFPVVGTGSDTVTIVERHDPDFFDTDDYCLV